MIAKHRSQLALLRWQDADRLAQPSRPHKGRVQQVRIVCSPDDQHAVTALIAVDPCEDRVDDVAVVGGTGRRKGNVMARQTADTKPVMVRMTEDLVEK